MSNHLWSHRYLLLSMTVEDVFMLGSINQHGLTKQFSLQIKGIFKKKSRQLSLKVILSSSLQSKPS